MTATQKGQGNQISSFPMYKITPRPGVQISRTLGRAEDCMFRSSV